MGEMGLLVRRSRAAWLIVTLLASGPRARADQPPPSTLAARPIRDSIERVIEKHEQEQKDPCRKAVQEGVPCFPVTNESLGPGASVRDSLRHIASDGRPAPGRPPTLDEMKPFRPGSATQAVPLVSFDPVCAAKAAWKQLRGKNDVYYLYRIRDARGERVALYDHRVDALRFQGELAFLGRYEGECEARAAHAREARKLSLP